MQSFVRQVIAKKKKWQLRYQKKSTQIQSWWRKEIASYNFITFKQSSIKIQRWHRKRHYLTTLQRNQQQQAVNKISQWYYQWKENRNIIRIQTQWRSYLARKDKRRLYQELEEQSKKKIEFPNLKSEKEISLIIKEELINHQKEMEAKLDENIQNKIEEMFAKWEADKKIALYQEWEENMIEKLTPQNQEKYWSQANNQGVFNFLQSEINKQEERTKIVNKQVNEMDCDISKKNELIRKISQQSAEHFSVSLSLTEKIGKLLMDNCELKEKLKYKRKKGWFS